MKLLMSVAAAVAIGVQGTGGRVTVKPEITEARGFADWDLDGNGSWAVRGSVLALEKEGTAFGKIRRPFALAILKSEPLTDLTFKLDVRSTAPVDLAVRDVQVIVGYQSPTRFYYVHLSAKTDAVHNGIFIVNEADRRRIDQPTSTARLTDQAWHRVRLERNVEAGTIAVYFDDDPKPVLAATDKTFAWGRVGLGSFDEVAEFRNVEVTGTRKP